MDSRKPLVAVAVLILAGVAVVSFYQAQLSAPTSQCAPVVPGHPMTSHVSSVTFGGVTEYKLPSQGRWPNAITTAPDGSIWFAEEEVPGVAHLYPLNGTLVEYAWPGYPTPKTPDCLYATSTWGIALWDGRVWAADQFSNALIGLNPSDGSTVRVNTTTSAQYPYWLAVGPDGDLWFTSANTPAALGRISPNLTLSVIKLNGLTGEEPIQVTFVNRSLAFVAAVNETGDPVTKTCVCTGHIYSFDPSRVSSPITPEVVGGNYTMLLPTSVSYSDGKVWVAQHGPSSVLSYDFASGVWTKYPTSLVPWSTTLPLVIDANGGTVWFNEHYANKIAVVDPSASTLTEISESDPPASSSSGIQNDESIARGNGGLWFTSLNGNYVGFISEGYRPSFSLSAADPSVTIAPGGSASVPLTVSGTWSSPLGVNASDSETYGSIPKFIHVEPAVATVPVGGSLYSLVVNLSADQNITTGRYVVTVTLTEGGVQQSAFLFVTVS